MNAMSSNGSASLGELIATVSHELRQPLASIRGLTEMMLGHWADFTDEDKLRMLQGVLHDAERVGRMIDELLDVSRLESGQLALHRRATDVASVAARVVGNLKLSYPDLEATLDIDEQLATIVVDPFKLEQVFANIVENACKYGSPAGIHITASHKPTSGAGEVEISVSDKGEGIAADDLPHVTEKFYRGGEGKSSGLGLGLWISKEIVEAHGGELVAASVVGAGTTVSFTIPLHEDARTGKLAGL
jgi:signal transduction histidine kinase